MGAPSSTVDLVRHAIATVDDPEFPEVSIVDLGLLETVEVRGGDVFVGLIPTFSGCPALDVIRSDVETAVGKLEGVDRVSVEFLVAPVWSTERISPAAVGKLANRFTVAVRLGSKKVLCPRCGQSTSEVSAFGPTRCRSVNRCSACGEVVEVMR